MEAFPSAPRRTPPSSCFSDVSLLRSLSAGVLLGKLAKALPDSSCEACSLAEPRDDNVLGCLEGRSESIKSSQKSEHRLAHNLSGYMAAAEVLKV